MNDRAGMPDDARIESLRLPPHSIEAEQAVLGGLLLNNASWDVVGDLISEGDFYRADHRALWRAITRQIEDNKPADVLTVGNALKADKDVRADALTYLHQIASGTPSVANIRRYAEIVREQAILRRLAEAGCAIADSAYARQGREARQVLDEAENRILEIRQVGTHRDETFRGMSSMLAETMNKLDDLHRNPNSVTGKSTGFVDLDEKTTGLQDGDLIVVAGRPSSGKTALAMNLVEAVAIEQKLPVLVFSMEMSGTQLMNRFLSSVGRVDSHKIRTGRLDSTDWERLSKALAALNEAPIEIDESGALTALEVRARARRKWRQYGGIGLIVVDYLQLMQVEGDNNRATQLSDITRALKLMGKELSCPVVVISQLNRSLESRTNKRPIMSDLRDSGGIEQDADVIFFVYRDEVYDEESPDKGIAEIIIGKQRAGPIGTVRLTFISHLTRFENLAASYVPPVRKPKQRSFTEKD